MTGSSAKMNSFLQLCLSGATWPFETLLLSKWHVGEIEALDPGGRASFGGYT